MRALTYCPRKEFANESFHESCSPYFFNLDFSLPTAICSAYIMAVVLALGMIGVSVLPKTPASNASNRRSWLYMGYTVRPLEAATIKRAAQ